MPRAGLSAEVIVGEATAVMDETGRDQLTLAELAKRFGVAQPSLYKHIDGLDALQRLIALKVMREVADSLRRAATGKAGEDALRAIANAYRGYALKHPARYSYVVRAPAADDQELAAASDDILSVLNDVFAGYDITGTEAVDAARFLRSALHGFVSLERCGGFKMRRSVDRSFERLVTATDQAFAAW